MNGHFALGRPWAPVKKAVQLVRDKKTYEAISQAEMRPGDKFEQRLRELEETLPCRDEELLLNGKELQHTCSPPFQQSGSNWLIM